jgi:hypothetical protein
MGKKSLIGVSICAVVLLILGSLSNVIGYQSVKSTAVNDSPLFSVRTKRATNQINKNTFTFNYLGRGIESNFQFPKQENKTSMLQKVIAGIRAMDENEFGRFQSLVILSLYKDKSNKNIESILVLSLLKQIRSPAKILPIIQIDDHSDEMEQPTTPSVCATCDTIHNWHPGCFIQYFIYFIVLLTLPLFLFILNLLYQTILIC